VARAPVQHRRRGDSADDTGGHDMDVRKGHAVDPSVQRG
jgi:hypothetical protein